MAVVYIPADNMDVWKSLGTALGTFLGKRAQDIQKTNEAKDYANAWFPSIAAQASQPQEQKTMADYVQQAQNNTPTIPRISGGLLSQALQGVSSTMPSLTASAQPITGTTTSGGVVGSGLLSGNVQNGAQTAAGAAAGNGGTTIAPSLANAAQAYMAQPNFNSAPQEQAPNDGHEENGLPSVPDRQAIRQKNMADNGAVYRDLYVSTVKAGYSPEEARAMTLDRVKQDEDSAYNAQRSEYISKVLNPMKEQILNALIFTKDKDGNTVVDTYHSSKLPGMIPLINKYNEESDKVGADHMDLNSLNSIAKLTKPDYKYMQGKNGHIVRINGDNGAVSDAGDFSDPRDQYVRTPAGLWDVKNRKFISDPAVIRNIEISQQRANAQDRMVNSNIAMNNYRMTNPVGGGGGGNGGNSILNAQYITSLRQLYKQVHDEGIPDDQNQFYAPLMKALSLNGGGSSGDTPNKGYAADEDKMSKAIMDSYYHNGHDATINLLHSHGWYNYDSWVPDDK
ncbi:hypothetical protein [uncultured Dialister sp.]|uniref:hypothetical protein n=1 Tax=uncultured Dialister sp. TaxID=278064 RepID=UPI002062C0F8|nr:hypothetical protein [uncultured Dialister sp.]DAE67640.1 MAG TPA: hypothetical protein [Caudoviricetes sp.]